MPWKEWNRMELRAEFVEQVLQGQQTMAAVCREYGIARRTGYKWLARYQAAGLAGLADGSRRPHQSPQHTEPAVEAQVLALRRAHGAWGGRKIRARLLALGEHRVPAASTITDILRRHGYLDPEASAAHRPVQRFERQAPNELWQIDFKGHVGLSSGGRCHPLSMLDDHSRYNLALVACANEQRATVQAVLERTFGIYGLPDAMLMDNGPPWGGDATCRCTTLGVWLMRLAVQVLHGRPRHPQTQGKEERFHRTLAAEVLAGAPLSDLASAQERLDAWRIVYNQERPHEALGLAVPAARYVPSPRALPARLPEVSYPAGALVRRVYDGGRISFQGRRLRVGRAFEGLPVALTPLDDGRWAVTFCGQDIARLDLRSDPTGLASA
jgi:transposase InsO family protein